MNLHNIKSTTDLPIELIYLAYEWNNIYPERFSLQYHPATKTLEYARGNRWIIFPPRDRPTWSDWGRTRWQREHPNEDIRDYYESGKIKTIEIVA